MGHTNRTIAEGSNLWAFVESGTMPKTYKPFAAQTNFSISDDSDQLESTAKNNGPYANYQYGRERWGMTLEMMNTTDTDTTEVSYDDIVLMRKKKQKPVIFAAWVDAVGVIDTTKKAFRGEVLLKLPKAANNGELEKVSVTMQGCRELEYLEYDTETSAWVKVLLA